MAGLLKLAGAYLMLLAIAVAVFFIINNFLLDTIDVMGVWLALDVLMLIGLAAGLYYNYSRKKAVDAGDESDGVTRGYFEANAAFFVTAGVSILFLHNWFALLANGSDYLDGNHQSWVIWAVVDTLLPLILGITGCHMWKHAGDS
ncbi:MAG: hypothetical protein OXN21_01905 [Chloroflexota bacterium]|nr:hypothetical protein [Chloroflexota bacterium]